MAFDRHRNNCWKAGLVIVVLVVGIVGVVVLLNQDEEFAADGELEQDANVALTSNTPQVVDRPLWQWCDPIDSRTSKRVGIRMLWPTGCSFSEKAIKTSVGVLISHESNYAKDPWGGTYQVLWVDYPSTAVKNPSNVLDGARDGVLAETGGTLVGSEDFVIKGIPCRAYSATFGPKFSGQFRVCLSGTRLFQVGVLLPSSYPKNDVAGAFLGSMELTPRVRTENGQNSDRA